MKKAIVTGANGFIGKQLVSELLSRNIDVIAIDICFDEVLSKNDKVVCINCKEKSPFDLEEALRELKADVFSILPGPEHQVSLGQIILYS